MDSLLKEYDHTNRPVDRAELIALFRLTTRLMARSFHRGQGHAHHAQEKILHILKQSGPLPQSELLDILDIRSASLSELLSKLENTGMVTREKNEADRRSFVISLTPLAQTEIDASFQDMRSKAQELLSCLSESECRQLSEILNNLSRSLKKNDQEDFHGRHGFGRHHAGMRIVKK
jgi:Transcriptional regulators